MMMTWRERESPEDPNHRGLSSSLRSHGCGQDPDCGQGHGAYRGKDQDKEDIPVTKMGLPVQGHEEQVPEETYLFSLPIKES